MQEDTGRRRLDELELVGHYEQWREDIDRAAAIGFTAMRCGVPWYRVEPAPGRFDWSWTDQMLEYMVDLGLRPIADLVHYGTPLWMPDAFADPRYVTRVTAYASAFAERYAGIVRNYTPVNEPGVTALVCGYAGVWPPHPDRPRRLFPWMVARRPERHASTIPGRRDPGLGLHLVAAGRRRQLGVPRRHRTAGQLPRAWRPGAPCSRPGWPVWPASRCPWGIACAG